MEAVKRKRNGIHYTPARLARFLAEQTARFVDPNCEQMDILDPACGDGRLLSSLLTALPFPSDDVRVLGFDTSLDAVKNTRTTLAGFELEQALVRQADFLGWICGDPLFGSCTESDPTASFDCVIANPPYVRTQVLGGKRAQLLARKFGLTGRVDLYQAFAFGICQVLRPGGVLGLLTSNRFLTVHAGAAMRQLLAEQFAVKAIFDLGDSKLFDAAVLPVVVIATKNPCADHGGCEFHRVYSSAASHQAQPCDDLLGALADGTTGQIHSPEGYFHVERGQLTKREGHGAWSLGNKNTAVWLAQVRENQVHSFADVAEIKVGIKTTADKVFIRDDWDTGGPDLRPEPQRLHPLLTHHVARRWSRDQPVGKQVLYPYDLGQSRRTIISRARNPKTFAYLEQHREQLESRKYVIESGRQWFEIWVPHRPVDWAYPKIVWPDISEQPRFYLDTTGAIVNGDCYWIKLREGVEADWLYLMLAVANSTVATRFYDTMFHNKLYAGRRRFMTQYVKEFPLPRIATDTGRQIVSVVKQLVARPSKRLETHCERLVQVAFGF